MESRISFSLTPGSSTATTTSFLVSYMSTGGVHARSVSGDGCPEEVVEEPVHLGLDVHHIPRRIQCLRKGTNRMSAMAAPPVCGALGPGFDMSVHDLYMLS